MYSIAIDGTVYGLASGKQQMKVLVVDAILHIGQSKRTLVEYYPDKKRTVQLWHVFAHNGYHLVEVVKL